VIKLHLGCGRTIKEGWVNVDNVVYPGVVRYNLDGARQKKMPWLDNTVEEVYCAHTMEHLQNPLPMMEELWRVCEPGAIAVFECPYGSSDDAYEDPTHTRPIFPGFWIYFAQPTYWRADYGYRGDWKLEILELEVQGETVQGFTEQQIMQRIVHGRNVVLQQRAFLRCIKPRRPVGGPDDVDPIPAVLVPVRFASGECFSDRVVNAAAAPDLGADELAAEGDSGSEHEHDGTADLLVVDVEQSEQTVDGDAEGQQGSDEPGGLGVEDGGW
jgi:hypothetical protein